MDPSSVDSSLLLSLMKAKLDSLDTLAGCTSKYKHTPKTISHPRCLALHSLPHQPTLPASLKRTPLSKLKWRSCVRVAPRPCASAFM
jgi:hypothetical protein